MDQADRVFVRTKTYQQRYETDYVTRRVTIQVWRRKNWNRYDNSGWTDSQVVPSIVLLNLPGEDCVDDLKKMKADDGFGAILCKSEMHGLKRKVRRALDIKNEQIFILGLKW